MTHNQFDIFEKDNKFRLSANIIVYSIFVVSLPTAFFADKYLGESFIEQVGLYGLFVGFGLSAILKWVQLTNRKTFQGKLLGKITFEKDSIRISGQNIPISDIEKIELEVGDYLDRKEYNGLGEFNPTLSTGTENICHLKLKDGTEKEVYFQIKQKDDFKKLRQELIEYHKSSKISWLKLIELLGIDEYEEIQEFKKTLMPTKPIRNAG